MTEPTSTAHVLLRDAENYLSALHGSVARHDHLAANLGCAGCELRDRIAAALPGLAAVSSPPADQTTLRDRIRRAVCEAEGFMWSTDTDMLEPDEYGEVADAVLAVLPAPADRAAIVGDAVTAVRDGDLGPRGGMSRDYENGWWDSRAAAEERVRRLADEAQPATPDTETDEQRADREETERDHARGDHTYCGITCETEMPTKHLRNFVIAKGYPGTKGALDELLRRARTAAVLPATSDTLPAWLYRRFMPDGIGWDNLDADDRSYWEHQARAVRRAVARGGFKRAATSDTETPVHLGDQANAENCPGCKAERRNLPYPFLCPAVSGAAAAPAKEV
ncbi:hypothetical protein [Streptomyces ziwulingensis]|uniref:Uncharacterized protein n=1 Tax=Streptomyces ziwulingensis TaxID=1045501 RepID=A0ABP9D037_9ACTN